MSALKAQRAATIWISIRHCAGHGRNPSPLAGNTTREDGATRTLVAETAQVADLAQGSATGASRSSVIANAAAFAWAIGVTFPLLVG